LSVVHRAEVFLQRANLVFTVAAPEETVRARTKGWRYLLPNQPFDEDILISYRDMAAGSRQLASTRLAEAPETVRA
jgi:hypothetical protein